MINHMNNHVSNYAQLLWNYLELHYFSQENPYRGEFGGGGRCKGGRVQSYKHAGEILTIIVLMSKFYKCMIPLAANHQ